MSVLDERVERLAQAALRIGRTMLRMGQLPRDSADLRPQQTAILLRLVEDGPKTISELRASSCSAQSTTSEMVARLARAGLVQKKTSREDSRVVQVAVSSRGRAVLEEKRRAMRAHHRVVLERLSDDNQLRLIEAIETIESLLGEAAGVAAPAEDEGDRE